jgi:hypothetical protein
MGGGAYGAAAATSPVVMRPDPMIELYVATLPFAVRAPVVLSYEKSPKCGQ